MNRNELHYWASRTVARAFDIACLFAAVYGVCWIVQHFCLAGCR